MGFLSRQQLLVATQDPVRKDNSDFNCTSLAKEGMVCRHCELGGEWPLGASSPGGHSASGSSIAYCFTVAGFNSLAIGTQMEHR